MSFKLVDDYFSRMLKQGLTIPEVIETFKHPLLPHALNNTGFSDQEIRRAAQIVSTRRIHTYNQQLSAEMDL